ncbi:hypothetical protein EDD15DRAFT_2374403 [Pisolithus albus]|nr:hypothetical protein EDD15DRAFT_2374403 [Pisolithus albus]
MDDCWPYQSFFTLGLGFSVLHHSASESMLTSPNTFASVNSQNPPYAPGPLSFNVEPEEEAPFMDQVYSDVNGSQATCTSQNWAPSAGDHDPFASSQPNGASYLYQPPPLPQPSQTQEYFLPQLPTGPLPTEDNVSARLRAAAAMIQASGNQMDILEQHQSRRGASRLLSQTRLCLFRDTPYSASHSSRTMSVHTSSQVSQSAYGDTFEMMTTTTLSHCRSQREPVCIVALIDKVGWCAGKKGRATRIESANECFSQAVIALGKGDKDIECTKEMANAIERILSTVQGKLAQAAESYARKYLETDRRDLLESSKHYMEWMQEHVSEISNPKVKNNFFLHEYDGAGEVLCWFGNKIFEDFHLEFWYTHSLSPVDLFRNNYSTTPLHGYSMSATALLCALHRVSTGHVHLTNGVIKFSGKAYGPQNTIYYDSMQDALRHPNIGTAFQSHLDWINTKGLQMLDQLKARPASPQKLEHVYLPPPVEAANHEYPPPPAFSAMPYTTYSANCDEGVQFTESQAGPSINYYYMMGN